MSTSEIKIEIEPEVISTITSFRSHKKECPARTITNTNPDLENKNFVNFFKCSNCELVFEFRSQLLMHELSHKLALSIPKNHICDICGFKETSKSKLNNHIHRHIKSQKKKHREHKPTCDICKREYKDPASLQAHNEAVHAYTLDYSCNVCKSLFISVALVRLHIKTEHAGWPSLNSYKYVGKLEEDSGFYAANTKWLKRKQRVNPKADLGSKSVKITTTTASTQNDPIFDVATEKLFEIKLNHMQSTVEVDKKYDNHVKAMVKIVSSHNETKDVNSKHMQTIYKDGKTIIDPVEFFKEVIDVNAVVKEEIIEEELDITLPTAPNLLVAAADKKYLVNAQKFTCSSCHLTFTHESSLLIHQVQHNLRKSTNLEFTCDLCNLKFSEKFSLEVHMNVMHCPTKSYACGKCNFVTTQYHLLSHHRLNHRRKCLKCYICKKVFSTRELLKEHEKKAHEYPCEVCGKIFKTKTYVKRHFKVTHSGEHKFKCNFCKIQFASRSAVNQHVGSLWKIGKCSSFL